MNVQLLYEAALCIWQLTFLPQAAEVIAASGIVASLVDLARVAPKEKVHCRPLQAARGRKAPSQSAKLTLLHELLELAGFLWICHHSSARNGWTTLQGPRREILTLRNGRMQIDHRIFQGCGCTSRRLFCGLRARVCTQVVRVALNALNNLLQAPGLDAGPGMVEAGLPKVVAQRKQQARPCRTFCLRNMAVAPTPGHGSGVTLCPGALELLQFLLLANVISRLLPESQLKIARVEVSMQEVPRRVLVRSELGGRGRVGIAGSAGREAGREHPAAEQL